MGQAGKTLAAAVAALVIGVAAGTARADVTRIELPPDGLQLKPSTLPGYAKAQANCVACHSAEYMAYQPPTAARPYWEAMVKRMKGVFKGPVDEADMPAIVEYLVKTYGNEQSR
jgi:mono/diheme cytochrome c family protein